MDYKAIPQLKTTIQRTDLDGQIYLRSSARTTELDKNGVHQCVIEAIDGTKTVGEIITLISKKGFDTKIVESAFKELDTALFLDDVRHINANYVDERWTRNINFIGSFCKSHQSKYKALKTLSETKVTLLGLGGLGSHILYGLASLGVKDIQAIEFDCVEASNLNRQILYTPADIGRSKAEVAGERIYAYSPELKFNVVSKKISSANDVYEVAKTRDLVICVADRPKMEILYWVNEACVKAGVPLITGGLDTQVARYYSMVPEHGCLECWRTAVRKEAGLANALLNEQRRKQLRGDNAAFAPFVSMIAGLMLAEFVKLSTGLAGAPTAVGKVREIDFKTLELKTIETWHSDPLCSCCSARGAA